MNAIETLQFCFDAAMISAALQKWTPIIFVLAGFVYSQFPIPYPMGPPMGYRVLIPAPPPQPVPVPMPMPFAVPIPVPYRESSTQPSTTTTTSTTTQRTTVHDGGGGTTAGGEEGGNGGDRTNGIAMAIPIPIPMVQFAVPAFTPQICPGGNCPPCPPCTCDPCTPSFYSYCSPCHQKCRCKNNQSVPIPPDPNNPPPQPFFGPAFPMPIPLPAPPPIVMIPFPHHFDYPNRNGKKNGKENNKKKSKSSDDSSDSSSGASDCDASSSDDRSRKGKGKGKGKNKGKYGIYRRSLQQMKKNLAHIRKTRDSDLVVRPVLTYVSSDGDIKLKTSLSRDEATALLDKDNVQGVQFVPGRDEDDRPSLLMISPHQDNNIFNNETRHQILLRLIKNRMNNGNLSISLKDPFSPQTR